jgi:hypothetical protein
VLLVLLIVSMVASTLSLAGYKDNPPPLPGWHRDAAFPNDDSPQRHGVQLVGTDITRSSPIIANVDGDTTNGNEVVVGGSDGMLYVYRSDGRPLWEPINVFQNPTCRSANPEQSRLNSSVAVGELYGDGVPYVVVTYGLAIPPGECDGGIAAYHGPSGQLDWRFSLRAWAQQEGYQEGLYGVISTPALADTDGDGRMEIGFGGLDRNVYLLNADGSVRWYYHAADTVWSSPSFLQLDADGPLEMVIGTDISFNADLNPPTPDGGYVYAFDTQPQTPLRVEFRDPDERITVWRTRFDDQAIYSSPAIGDVLPDNPGDEIVIGSSCFFPVNDFNKLGRWVKILRPSDGTVLQTLNAPACVQSSPALGDLDDDGRLEIAATVSGDHKIGGDGLSRVVAWNATDPTPFWSVAPGDPNSGANDTYGGDLQSPIIADIDGNGSLEVIVANFWSVHIFAGKTGQPLTCQNVGCSTLASLFAWKTLKSTPAVGDINADGKLDLVIGGGHVWNDRQRGMLYAWTDFASHITSVPSSQPAFSAPWAMFRGNPEQPGHYIGPRAPAPPPVPPSPTETPSPVTQTPTAQPEQPTTTPQPTPTLPSLGDPRNQPLPVAGWQRPPAERLTDDTPQRHGVFLQGGDVSRSSPTIADIDGNLDNGKEVAVGTRDGWLNVYGSNGTLLWATNVLPDPECNQGGERLASGPAVGRIFGADDDPYVVIGYGGVDSCDGGVVAYNGRSGLLSWRFSLTQWNQEQGLEPSPYMFGVWSTPALADTDDDGRMEIGFAGFDSRIYLLNADSSVRWSYDARNQPWSSPAFVNVDADPALEMVIGTGILGDTESQPPTENGGYVYAFDTQARTPALIDFDTGFIWQTFLEQAIFSSPVIGDVLPGNPGPELIIGSGCTFPFASTDKIGKWIKILRLSDGEVLQTLNAPACVQSSVALGDLDDDGMTDIVATVNGDESIGGDGFSRIVAWNATNPDPLWAIAPTDPNSEANDPFGGDLQSPVIADLDGNGSLEVIAANFWSVVILNGRDGYPLTCQNSLCGRQVSLFGWKTLKSTPAIGDINNDGRLDLVIGGGHIFGSNRGVLYAWTNFAGQLRSAPGNQARSTIATGMFRSGSARDGVFAPEVPATRLQVFLPLVQR